MKIKRVVTECWPRFASLADKIELEKYRELAAFDVVDVSEDIAAHLIEGGFCVAIEEMGE